MRSSSSSRVGSGVLAMRLLLVVLTLLLASAAVSAQYSLFSYSQHFEGRDSLMFDFEVRLTSVDDGNGLYTVQTASGSVIRSDVGTRAVTLVDQGGFESNDNKLMPSSNPVLTVDGIDFLDSNSETYNLYYQHSAYGLYKTGSTGGGPGVGSSVVTFLCCVSSIDQTSCPSGASTSLPCTASVSSSSSSSSSSTGSSSAPPCVISYSQYFSTGDGSVSVVGTSFVLDVQLTATPPSTPAGAYLVTAATGTVTRSDDNSPLSVQLLSPPDAGGNGGFEGNDNLFFPNSATQQLVDRFGLAVVDSNGIDYNVNTADGEYHLLFNDAPGSSQVETTFTNGYTPTVSQTASCAVPVQSCVYSYSQQLTFAPTVEGESGPAGPDVSFDFELQLTAAPQSSPAGSYLVSAATGTVTRSDEAGAMSVQLIATPDDQDNGGFEGNDNLLFPGDPSTVRVVDGGGISVQDTQGQQYNLYSEQPGGPPATYVVDFTTTGSDYTSPANGLPSAVKVTQLCCLSPGQTTCPVSVTGDPVFVGFHGQRFLVHGLPQRVYNILSLPQLQLNTRFIPLSAGQAMNVTQQRSVRQRQSKLLSALKGAGAANRLPSTTSWSHDGLYMGDTAVLVSGHRLLLQPGAYVSGFSSVQLDGVEVAVSSEAVQLADGATITRESSSVLRVHTPAVSFTLVNSDRFVNLHDAVLTMSADQQLTTGHIDGLLGQTADASFAVSKAKAWRQHVEDDFLLPRLAGGSRGEDELWSSDFEHSRYEA